MHRREVLKGAGALAAATALWRSLLARSPPAADPWLDALCDVVIPDSDTPGARKAGVASFVRLAAAHGLAGSSPADLTELKHQLDHADTPFERLSGADQHAVLVTVDARDAANPATQWARIKKLILMGYYTSQIGASQELHYQLVPGRFDPDVPVHPGDRAWSSDWIGQGF
jgi:Gluconate 2-dehydrogenase subunit 3/TAT (twin-arginine translocation) pathway signal sequence